MPKFHDGTAPAVLCQYMMGASHCGPGWFMGFAVAGGGWRICIMPHGIRNLFLINIVILTIIFYLCRGYGLLLSLCTWYTPRFIV